MEGEGRRRDKPRGREGREKGWTMTKRIIGYIFRQSRGHQGGEEKEVDNARENVKP
jgi:hypothetical protein